MNRHARRAQKSVGPTDAAPASAATVATSATGIPVSIPSGPPSLGLRIFSRLLLSNMVLKRVNQPDLIAVLLQIAEQVGRTDAVVRLTTKLHVAQR